ncbi:MAG: hypothetical protein GY874_01605 [Desulfobacteraceae bacterium]|nr:hypothetical protein [Desulfobacteraceae bacterium]
MVNIFEILIGKLANGEHAFVTAILVILAVALPFNLKKIIDFIEDLKKARIVKLAEALECRYIKGLTKKHIEDELATEHFKISTGIRLERKFREALIQAHRDTNGELSFYHYKKALNHINYREGAISVHISLFERVVYFVNIVGAFILAILAFLFMAFGKTGTGVTLIDTLSRLGIGFLLLAMAFIFLYQTISVISARKIRTLIKKNNNTSNVFGTNIQPTKNYCKTN